MNIMFLTATRLLTPHPKVTSPQQKASFHTAGQLFPNMHEMHISCSSRHTSQHTRDVHLIQQR